MLRRVHRGLLVPEIAFLPIIALALHFVFVGVRLVSPTHLQAHHNTLGRFMFIAALVILGGSLAAVARPRWPNLTAPGGLAVRRTDVGIQLSILLSTILPAALAALGFYVTAILIAYQALRMAWLAFGVILAAGMIARWMAIRERRRRSALAGAEPDAEAVTAESQTRGFLQFMLAVVVAIGLYGIWSDAFPMLVMLKRVELWSRFQVRGRSAGGTGAGRRDASGRALLARRRIGARGRAGNGVGPADAVESAAGDPRRDRRDGSHEESARRHRPAPPPASARSSVCSACRGPRSSGSQRP